MPRNRTQSLTTLLEKHCKPVADIVYRKEAHTSSVGVPFIAKIEDSFTLEDAAPLADLVALHGPEKSISLLSR